MMLINTLLTSSTAYSQSNLDAPVKYEARDSIVANIPNQIVTLYGEANVQYEGIDLKADFIEINLKNNEVIATYSLDSAGVPTGKPLFTSEGEESKCDYIKYNFKTKKGYIKEVRAQQDEGYIHMAESKIHPNEQIHLKNGKFTTCENDTPHYHFKLTKAVIVPDKRVVTGPVYMKIGKIPTPLAAPFAFFPNSDSKKHGIIIPSFTATSAYGFGLQDLGYYIPLGEYWETQFNGTIYTTGRFSLGNTTNYYRKYRSRGSFNVRYDYLRGYFYDENISSKVTLRWNHTQDPKAHPNIKFSTNINYVSDNNGKTSLDQNNENIFNSQFNSSIKLSKSWKTRKLTGSATLNTSLSQNSKTSIYDLNLPDFNLSVSRFDLGVLRKNKIGKKWYEEINISYGLASKNLVSAPDSLFNQDLMGTLRDNSVNGLEHNITVNSNLKLLGGRFNFTPSVRYREFMNFQYQEHDWNNTGQAFDTTEVNGIGAGRNMSLNGSLTTGFYGYYKFKGERGTRFKHVANPTLSFSYTPNLSSYQTRTKSDGTEVTISPFNSSLYKERVSNASGTMSWVLNNTLKMKTRDMKDTINETDKTFNIIDALSISGSYNFLADSNHFSTQNISFRTSKFLKVFSFQSSATLDPYSFDTLNIKTKDLAIQNGGGFGKILNTRVAVTANFTSRSGRKKQDEIAEQTANNANLTGALTNPNNVNWDIPWNLNVSYNLNHTLNTNKDSASERNYNVIQTVVLNGDFSINQKWKLKGSMSLDLQQFNPAYQPEQDITKIWRPREFLVTTYNFEIWRDLHCWEAMLSWRQIGAVNKEVNGLWGNGDNAAWKSTNWVFLFRVNIKASMFQDIKLEYNQPPIF